MSSTTVNSTNTTTNLNIKKWLEKKYKHLEKYFTDENIKKAIFNLSEISKDENGNYQCSEQMLLTPSFSGKSDLEKIKDFIIENMVE